MRFSPLLPAFLLYSLSACQQNDVVSPEEFERLQDKVSQLETDLSALKATATKPAEPSPPSRVAVSPAPVRQDRYRLVGTSFQNDPDLRYASKAECEAAKGTLLRDWREEDDQRNSGGIVIYRSRPSPSCLPL